MYISALISGILAFDNEGESLRQWRAITLVMFMAEKPVQQTHEKSHKGRVENPVLCVLGKLHGE